MIVLEDSFVLLELLVLVFSEERELDDFDDPLVESEESLVFSEELLVFSLLEDLVVEEDVVSVDLSVDVGGFDVEVFMFTVGAAGIFLEFSD